MTQPPRDPVIALCDIDRVVYAIGTQVEENEPLGHALHSAKLMVQALEKEIKEVCPSIKYIYYFISDDKNFRKMKDLEQKYKGNRPPAPAVCKDIREYLKDKFSARSLSHLEADDHTAMNHYNSGGKTLLVDVDKDADQFEGWRMRPSSKNSKKCNSIEEREAWKAKLKAEGKRYSVKDNNDGTYKVTTIKPAEVWWIDQHEADLNFYGQLLSGDRADNIPGLKGVGKQTAHKILADCKTAREMYEAVVEKYIEHYTDISDMYEAINERGNLLYMRRFPNDWWKAPRREE